jgi:hypothetical protein
MGLGLCCIMVRGLQVLSRAFRNWEMRISFIIRYSLCSSTKGIATVSRNSLGTIFGSSGSTNSYVGVLGGPVWKIIIVELMIWLLAQEPDD